MNGFWIALGWVLVIVSPGGWRRMFTQLLQLRDGQIRFCALLGLIAGGAILLLT